MPDLNFPTSPTLNDTYSFNGKTWVWNGEGWQLQNQGAINGLVIGNVTPAAGTFTALSATGNIDGANINGNGSGLSSITGANVTGTVANATYATSAGSATSATTAGTVTGNAQANITSVGILTSFSSTGNIDGANINGNGSGLSSITGGNVTGTVANATYATSAGTATSATTANTAATVTGNAQANITSVGILTSLSSTGNITGANINGNGSGLSAITGANVTGTVANATYATSAGTATSATTAGTVTSNAQANITSVGILSSLSASGNITGGNIESVSLLKTTDFSITGNVTSNLLPSANITYDLGSNTQRWKDLYLSGNTIQLGSQTISANATSVSLGADAELAANNVFATNQVSGATVSASGNIVAGGSGSSGQISATGNITGGNLITGAAVSAASVSASGNITGGNILGGANVNATTHTGTTVSVSANINGGNLISAALVQGTTVSASGNVIGGNVNTNTLTGTGVTIGSTGNINLSASGNIVLSTQTYINNLSSPVQNNDAATKQYVDDVAQGLHTHDSCNAATPTTLATISGGTVTYDNGTSGVGATLTTTGTYTTIDGVTLSNGMRILVKNEVDSSRNGIYDRTSTTVLTRSTDFDTSAEMAGGDFTFVTAGTLYDNTGWVMTEPVTTVGTSPVPWVQFSGAGTYTAGTGLTLTGSEFSVNASQTQVTAVGTLGSLAVTANITGGNLLTGGLISATGNVTADYLFGNGSQLTGIAASYGNANVVANLAALGSNPVSTTGNITGGNLNAAGLSLSSNVISEINSTSNITTTANIAGSYFIGNGSQLTGIAGGGGNYSNANVATFLADFGSNVISTTGNVTAGNVISGGVRVYKWTTQANTAPSNSVPGDNWYDSYADKLYLYINDGVGNQWVDQSSPTTFASLNILGNTASGNLSTLGQLSAAGNVTGNYILGNGALLTGVITSVANINSGTSNVTVVSSGGNVTVGVGGTANVVQFANTGAFVTGVVSATGNITGGNLITGAAVSATSVSASGNVTGASVNATTLSATGNVQSGNLRTTGLISATGNVTGGNILTAGLISATGNGIIAGRDLMVGGAFNSFSTSGRGTIALNGTSTTLFEMAIANVTGGYMYHSGTDMYLWQSRAAILAFATNNTQ